MIKLQEFLNYLISLLPHKLIYKVF